MDYENKSTAVERRISPKFSVFNRLVAPQDGSKDGEDDLEYKGVETIDNIPLGKKELQIFKKKQAILSHTLVLLQCCAFIWNL